MMRPGGMGLRARLIALLLATLIPLVGLGIYWVIMGVRQEQAGRERDAQKTAALVSVEAGHLVSGVQGMLAVLARLPAVQESDRTETARLFRDLLPHWPSLENIALVSAKGVLLASAVSTPAIGSIHLEDRDWFQRTIRLGEPTVGGYQVGRVVGRPIAVLSYPVLDNEKRVTAVVTAGMRLAAVSQEVAPTRIKAPVVWAVADAQDLVLLHSEPWGAIGRPLGPLTGMSRAEAVVRGTPWRAVVGVPEATLASELWRVLPVVGLPVLLVLLGAGGVALWLARDIWRPLEALTVAVHRIAGGDRDFQMSIGGAGEVSEVAAALREALRAVTAREADLARRNNELSALIEATRRIASSLDLDQILQAIVEQATVISGTNFVRLLLLEDNRKQLRCRVGVGLPMEEERDLLIPVGESFSGQVVVTGKPLAVADTRGDPRLYYPQHTTRHSLISYLGLPVKLGHQVLGVLVFNTRAPRDYSSEEIAYLTTFADQAAIAIENARLFQAAQQAARETRSLYEVAHSLTTLLDPKEVLHVISAKATELLATPHAQVVLWEEDTKALYLGAAYGTQAGKVQQQQFHLGRGVNGVVAETRAPLIVNDYQTFPKRVPGMTELVAVIGVPLLYRGRLLGVLSSHSTTPGWVFTENHLALLTSFADQAAIAIENARLYGESQRHADTLEARVKERTAELEEALRAKIEFLGKMSHELRTPLNFVLGFSDLLQQGIGGPLTSKQANYVDRIQAGGRRLLSLVNDVLDLAQVDAGKSRLRFEPVILGPLIQEVLGLFQVQATQKRLKVTTVLDPWVPFIVADHFKLSQILQNLISNAVKFTPEDGSLRIMTRHVQVGEDGVERGGMQPRAASDSLELIVEDTGIGIGPENLETIFGAFYQVDGSETRAYGGAGLGLTLVRKLVEFHGGRVWAESPGLGQGSRFTVRLPRLEVPIAKRILLVEDEGVERIPMTSALENAGFVVVSAATGGDALTAMEATPFDLLVLDVLSPRLHGWQILQRVRETEDVRTLPVLVLIASEHVNAEQVLALGADEFLTKPVSPRVLVDTVLRLVAQAGVVRTRMGSHGKEADDSLDTRASQ